MNDDLIKVTLEADSKGFVRSIGDAGDALNTMGKGVDYVQNRLDAIDQKFQRAGKGLIATGLGVEAAMAANVKTAADYESAMNNVYTIVDRNSQAAKGLTQDVLDLSQKYPESAKSMAEGLYDIASSGIAAEDAVQVLDVSTKAAVAGLSQTATASRAITAALNAYGMGADKATYVSDVLFQTVNKGVVSFDDLAQNMGQWVGIAATAGVSLDDASAALAAMTLAGMPAAEASTALARTMQSFIKPGEEMTSVVKELGYETPLAMLQTLGLKGAIDEINTASGGGADALSKIFLEVTALTGVMALGSGEGKNYADVYDSITDRQQVAGATSRAYAEQSRSLEMQVKRLVNTFQAMRIEMGTYLMPIVKGVTKVLTSLLSLYMELPAPIKMAVTFITALSGVLMTLGGIFVLTSLKGKLVELAITRLNAKLGTNIPVVGSAAQMVLRLSQRYGESIPIIGQYSKRLNDSARSAKLAGIGAGALAGALIGGITAFAGYRAGVGAAREEVQQFDKDQRSAFESVNDMDGLANLVEEYEKQILASSNKISGVDMGNPGGWATAWSEGFSVITGQGSDMMNTVEAQKQMIENMELTDRQISSLQSNVRSYADLLGITEDEALALANTMGIDLTKGTELVGKTMKDGADATKGYTVQWGRHGKSMREALDQMNRGTYGSERLGKQLQQTSGNAAGLTAEVVELTEKQKDLQKALQAVANPSRGWDESLDRKRDLVQAMGDAELETARKALEAGKISQSVYDETEQRIKANVDSVRLSLREYADALEAQIRKGAEWSTNLAKIAERTNADVAGYLANMGEEGVDLVAAMATGTDEEVERMKNLIVLNMAQTGEQGALNLEAGLNVAAEKGRLGAAATREAISEELGLLVGDVDRISKQYGISLANGVNPVLDALGRPMIGSRLSPGVNENMTGTTGAYNYADGGFHGLPKEATYRPGFGRGIVNWAEGETEGEWFIPQAKSKRGRSVRLMEQMARGFGYQIVKMAEGGFMSSSDVPKPPKSPGGGMLARADQQVWDEAYDRTVKFVEAYGAAAFATPANATGLNPRFLQQFNLYNQALGNILTITSGWRSPQKQIELWHRYGMNPRRVARPGTSNHERGLAIDHSPNSTAAMRATAAEFGLRYPMSWEPWHVQPVWAANGGFLNEVGQMLDAKVGVFDTGGILDPGWNMAYNGTGAREHLVRADQVGWGASTVSVAVDMRGAQINGVEDLEAQMDKAGKKLVKDLTSALRKV